ncbi:alpha/beta hydrolase [Winogradskyella aurantiaca]|uniref:alpha/beta hydrolase n=1 Tax=Winogradskyella aurantiaca TaxID=2219558 RepID=UPI000E1D9B32|nr:esterase [Winogradskyella aurantiaca]
MNTHLEEKEIHFTAKNTYSTLNQLTDSTENIWFVCHGMGYLSRYFLKYFKELDPSKNYIVAPQAPSKYYQQPKMHVGANWLTRDNTNMGMETIINYFDAVFEAESLNQSSNLIVLGYSQGVSVAMRYLAKRQLQCQHLVLHSGGIPKELQASDFDYMNTNTKVSLVYGTEDEYLNKDRIANELARAQELFNQRLHVERFKGPHVVNVSFIKSLA